MANVTTVPIRFNTDKWGVVTLGGISKKPSTIETNTRIDTLSTTAGWGDFIRAKDNGITDFAQLAYNNVPHNYKSADNPYEVFITNGNSMVFWWNSNNTVVNMAFNISGQVSGTFTLYDPSQYKHAFWFIYPPELSTSVTAESAARFMMFSGSSPYEVQYKTLGGLTAPYAYNFFNGAGVYNFGDDSTTGGGMGNFDTSTDTIDFPNLPTGSALETGLINMYKCDSTDLRDFGEYLWGNSFFNEISKIFNDPMEAFVSLNLFPVTPTIGDAKTPIKIGNVFASKSASVFVTAYPLTSQYLEFDCGTVNINEFFGSALDYNPYTQVQIYLPFIGFQNLSADDIMDGTITLKYHIDMLTGTCTALIKCVKSNKYNLASVLYSFAGSMNMSVPISASNYGQAMGTLINGITGIGIGAAMGGAPAMLGVSATGSAMNIMNTKATVQRSGGIVMNAGALGNLTPYIIITRPVQHKPEDYQKFKGWENNITYTLSALQGKGYTEIMYTHIEGLTATDEEKAEIESLLKDGVIL